MATKEIGVINVRGLDYEIADSKARNTLQHLTGLTNFTIVDTLPVSDIKTNTVYLIQLGTTSEYTQYIYDSDNTQWITLGTTILNLDNYVAKNQISVNDAVLNIL